ncbi:MAG: hypothetical protein ABR577_12555 [Pyrinomonadaceae bacterium]
MSDYDEIFDEISDDDEEELADMGFLMDDENGDDDDDGALRSVVLAKTDLIALLCLKTSERGAMVVRVDPRQENPVAQVYEDAAAATKWFNRSIATSRRNGWQVIYDGDPAFG